MQMVDERSIFQGLVQRGLPPHVAQGFVMNMRDESGLNPAINEVSPTVPGSRGGFGLYQVTGPRRTAYEAFASDRGVDPADVDAQLDFLVSELKGPEQRAAQSIFATQDVPSAAAAIARDFLRPAPENLQRRVAQYTGGSTMQPQDLGSMSTQGAMPEQEKTPFYQNPDFWDRLALGFGGMTLNPNQALLSSVSERISSRAQERASTQQSNRTAEWLRSQGRPDLAEAVMSGSIDGKTAASIVYTQPKEQYNTITGEQLNAQRGTSFAPGDLFNVSPSGQITKVGGGPQTSVTVMPGGDKMADTFGAAVPGILEVGGQAQRSLIELDELERLLATTPQGVAGGLVQLASNFGFDVTGADDLQAAQAIINRLVPQQRQPGSGPMSDADLELFKQSLPRIINQPGGNQLIINTIRKIVEYDTKRADIVAQGLQAEKSPTQIMLEVYRLGNPLADVKSSFGGASPEGGTAAPKVRTYNPDTQRLE